jgi:hypothetical protein
MVEIYQSRLVSDLLASITYQIMERHNIKNAKKAYSIYCTNIGGTVQPFHGSKRETHGIWVEHQNASEGLSHLISEEEPNASHMCARISSHTYDRQK